MSAIARPQALLRALIDLGQQGLLHGGRPPPKHVFTGKAGLFRQTLAHSHAPSDAALRTPGKTAYKSSTKNTATWDCLRTIVDDAFKLVFRGVRREHPGNYELARSLSRFAAQARSSGLGGRQAADHFARAPLRGLSLPLRVTTPPVHAVGLQSARNFSSQSASHLVFNVPLAIRAVADEVEDELSKKHRGCLVCQASSRRRQLRSPRRSGDAAKLPFKSAVISDVPVAAPKSANKTEAGPSKHAHFARAASAVKQARQAEAAAIPPIDRSEFDYYFDSIRTEACPEEASVVSILCVPLDPDLASAGEDAMEQSWSSISSKRLSRNGTTPLVDPAFLRQRERLHADYEFHALRYIVPLERALDSPAWRKHLPRDWDMSLLITSAVNGVQRGDHCLEIRFVGTEASVIRDLLHETMGEERARWYSAFLSEERKPESEPIVPISYSWEDTTTSMSTPTEITAGPSTSSLTRSQAYDLGLDIDDMGVASQISFDELGRDTRSDGGSSLDSFGSATHMSQSLQFPTLAIATHEVASDSGRTSSGFA